MTDAAIRRSLMHKEMTLALQAPTVIFEFMCFMLFIPAYPYLITFFYATLGIFFVCVFGRENRDVEYTALLPVGRKSIVWARFTLCVGVELVSLALAGVCAAVRPAVGMMTNEAGMVPNAAFFGFAFTLLGIFNIIFFPMYYRNTQKIGVPYTIASIAYGAGMVFVMGACAVPVSPLYILDGYVKEYLSMRIVTLAAGAALYALLTWTAYMVSCRRFEKQNIV